MAELWLTALGSTTSFPLYTVGPYGAWGDLNITTRWGDGACGMFEASWTMPLPPDFEHPLLRRGTLVEVMDGPWRIGSPLVLSEPNRGTGFDDPWQLTAAGLGREVEGTDSWYCDDGAGNTTTVASTAVDVAIANGLRWGGRDATVPTSAFGAATTDQLNNIAALLNSYGDSVQKRWGVFQSNLLSFRSDPVTPTYQITPNAVALGTADDDYATVVKGRYLDSATGIYKTVTSVATNVQSKFGRREYPADLTVYGAISTATAQGLADGILAKSKGRLAWTNGFTVTSNDILTIGGVPADLSKVAEDVGEGCMVRVHGIWSDLLEFNGQTYLDLVLGEAKYVDGAPNIDLSPMGLAKRDLASITEELAAGIGLVAA